MTDPEIKFKREEIDGIVAVGTYLSDAARRFGIKAIDKCDLLTNVHKCKLRVIDGSDLLSTRTEIEVKLAADSGLETDERLACQTKIENSGEIVLMTSEEVKTEEQDKATDTVENYRKNFEEMPLEKKIADLVRFEAITFSETLSFIFNSPYHIGGKFLDVLAEFGLKKDAAEKAAIRPEEHLANAKINEESENQEPTDTVVESIEVDNNDNNGDDIINAPTVN